MLIVVTGPGAAGKDAVVNKLLEKYPNFSKVITTTSRPPRSWEKQDFDYHFLAKEEFEKLINSGELLEYVNFSGNYYGTTKDALKLYFQGKDIIWKVEITMGAKVKELYSDAKVFYIDVPDWDILRKRLKKRGMSNKVIEQRLAADKKDWEMHKDKFQNIIINIPGQLEKTVEEISRLLYN